MKYVLHQPQTIFELGKRDNQEDATYPLPGNATANDRVFVLCDGMGGLDKGEVASRTVSNAFGQYVKEHHSPQEVFTDAHFHQALDAAYQALDGTAKEPGSRMGTTLAFLYLHRGGALAAHIGDSRIYHIRPVTQEILYRSRDHSLVNQLYEMGEITKEQMRTSPQRNVILRAMQPMQANRSQADLVHITDIRQGDYFLLCTDGILERVDDADLMDLLADKSLTDTDKCERLRIMTSTARDNHTAFLIHIKNVESEEEDSLQPEDEAQARAENKALNDDVAEVEVMIAPDSEEEPPQTAQTAFMDSGEALRHLRQNTATTTHDGWQTGRMVIAIVATFLVCVCAYHFLLRHKIPTLFGEKKEQPALTQPSAAPAMADSPHTRAPAAAGSSHSARRKGGAAAPAVKPQSSTPTKGTANSSPAAAPAATAPAPNTAPPSPATRTSVPDKAASSAASATAATPATRAVLPKEKKDAAEEEVHVP